MLILLDTQMNLITLVTWQNPLNSHLTKLLYSWWPPTSLPFQLFLKPLSKPNPSLSTQIQFLIWAGNYCSPLPFTSSTEEAGPPGEADCSPLMKRWDRSWTPNTSNPTSDLCVWPVAFTCPPSVVQPSRKMIPGAAQHGADSQGPSKSFVARVMSEAPLTLNYINEEEEQEGRGDRMTAAESSWHVQMVQEEDIRHMADGLNRQHF